MKKFRLKEFIIFCVVSLATISFSFTQQISTNTITQELDIKLRSLVEQLKNHPDYSRRAQAATELEYLGDRRAIPYLIEARNDSHSFVRYCVLQALKGLAGKNAIPYLKEAFQNEQDDDQRYTYAIWLVGLGDYSTKKFIIKMARKNLHHEDQKTRILAALDLAFVKDKSGVNILLSEGLFYNIDDTSSVEPGGMIKCGTGCILDARIRQKTAEMLGELFAGTNNKKVISALKKALEKEAGEGNNKIAIENAIKKIEGR